MAKSDLIKKAGAQATSQATSAQSPSDAVNENSQEFTDVLPPSPGKDSVEGTTSEPKGETITPATPPPSAQDSAAFTSKPTSQTLVSKPVAEDAYGNLGQQAVQSGLPEEKLTAAYDSYNKGYMTGAQLEEFLNTWVNPKDKTDEAADNLSGSDTTSSANVDPGETLPADGYEEIKEDKEAAFDEYEKTVKEELGMAYKATQDAITAAAENSYKEQVKILDDALALSKELAAQQTALIASASDLQKEAAKQAFEANEAKIELQKKKVAEAFDEMKQQQELLNKQQQIKQETALGLIYGGFGSTAANKNLEDTVMKGESALMKIKKDAVNADTELQNQLVELNKAYSLDLQKIEQWKAEQSFAVYSQLQQYVQSVTADKTMAAVEKEKAISMATADYNSKIGELNAVTAQAKYDLSLSLIDEAEQWKKDYEASKIEQFNFEQVQIDASLQELDLMMTTYSGKEWDDLPDDVQNKMNELAEKINMPGDFAQNAFEIYKESLVSNETPEFKYFTDNNGNVTAVTYDVTTGGFITIPLGDVSKAQTGTWKSGKDANGNPILINSLTGETKSAAVYKSGSKGTIADALNVPDGSTGGQCGEFVNDYAGVGLGDDFNEKADKIDPSITIPSPGDIFVMPYSWTGHAGFVVSVQGNMVTVKDSNWGLDEKVQTHQIPLADITGFIKGDGSGATNEEEDENGETPDKEVDMFDVNFEEEDTTPMFTEDATGEVPDGTKKKAKTATDKDKKPKGK